VVSVNVLGFECGGMFVSLAFRRCHLRHASSIHNFWSACFLFSELDSTILYPFELFFTFFHLLTSEVRPTSICARRHLGINCIASGQEVCVESGNPIEVLDSLSTFTVLLIQKIMLRGHGVIPAIGLFFKVMYVIGVALRQAKATSNKQ
jgi:hypothetical protein